MDWSWFVSDEGVRWATVLGGLGGLVAFLVAVCGCWMFFWRKRKVPEPVEPPAPPTVSVTVKMPPTPAPVAQISPAPTDTIQTALARLAEMPEEPPAERHGLPRGSSVPLPNAHFVGRTQELADIARHLKQGDATAIVAATGQGGLGKSALANEFCHRYGQWFAGVHWLNCAKPEAIAAEVARVAVAIDPALAEANQPAQVAALTHRWGAGLPYLVVFDNCEEPAALDQWRAHLNGARALVTARREQWLGLQCLALEVLPRERSLELLAAARPGLSVDDPALDAIAAALGDLPLALTLAAAYLENTRNRSPAQYLAALEAGGALLHGSMATGEDRTRNVQVSIRLSWDLLDVASARDALAIRTLQYASLLAPGEPVPFDLLCCVLGVDEADDTATDALAAALGRARELGLGSAAADGGLVLHRLLAEFVAGSVADAEAVRGAFVGPVNGELGRRNNAGLPAAVTPWRGQLQYLASACEVALNATT